ncbi:tyrosine-type recombinase/integrase [Acuticoccus sediminis]|uniref:tyrosine-type recombinase/integrase n=1 Tax=Acuticoccus sediminis TaxID=2184697 RepID=UPI001392046F|nr:site-specific integrase [Acuticoccus sediminis]
MAVSELTDRACQAAKVVDGARSTNHFDATVKGLCLKVSAGGSKTFYLVYTKPGSKDRAWLKLGRYPELSLAKARAKARDTRADIGEGTDPIIEKRAAAAAQTVDDLIENYLTRHASTKRSADEIARRLRKNVGEVIGSVKLEQLHRRDLTQCIDTVKDRGAGVEANRVFEDLRAMVRWAQGRGDLDRNLTEGMKRPTVVIERDRVLSATEIRTMWQALSVSEMQEATRRIIRLCLITAQRVGEVSGMTLDEVDLASRLWTIPAARSKNKREHIVPLTDFACEIINAQLQASADLAKRKGRGIPPFVFPGPGARASITGAAVAKAVKRQEAGETPDAAPEILGISPWTPHDLRRSAATGMEELGVNPFVIGHVLNHISVTRASITTRVYARYDYSVEKREALESWSDHLCRIVHLNAGELTE